MTTQYLPDGFADTRELFDLASNFGLHCGSVDRLVRFAMTVQQRGNAARALDRMVANAEELGLYNEVATNAND